MRRLQSKLSVAFLAAAALVLASCGGGGATSSPGAAGTLQLLPGTASLYAGVPYTFNIVGGRKPYLVTSSEQTLVELNITIDGPTFSIVPRNPGVVDVGLDPNEVPRRTVNIEVRDSNGASLSNPYNVLQNFFTGYRETYANTCAAAGAGAVAPQACSGTDSVVTLVPVSNGTLYGNREYQFDKVRGDFQFVVEDPAVTPQLVNQIRVRTDQAGKAIVRLRVTNGASTQLATYKITDVATGVTVDAVFLIVQQAPVDAISVLPDTLAFTGASTLRCGSGSADVNIFGGSPPYTIAAAPGLAVSPTTVDTNGGRFTVTIGLTAPPCPPNSTIIVTDSRGSVATITVSNAAGATAPPVVTVAPNALTLACGQTGQVTVVGGTGTPFTATSSHPFVSAIVGGSVLSITRANVGAGPATAAIGVTDGTSTATVTATVPLTCP